MKWVPDKLQLKGLEFLLTRQAAAQARRTLVIAPRRPARPEEVALRLGMPKRSMEAP